MKFFISAGHIPTRPGACHDGFCEHDEAVKWVEEIGKHLDDMSMEWFSVPVGTISHKAEFINARCTREDVALEVHFNSFAAPYNYHKKVEGCETLYYPGSVRGKQAADIIQQSMLASHRMVEDRGVKEGWYQQNKKRGVIYILRKTICTCLIVEPEFIQHKAEIIAMRDEVCEAIAEGLVVCTTQLKKAAPSATEES